MLKKQAISQVDAHSEWQGFLSSIFLVPKKDGGHRPIINLKKLNEFIPYTHFKMERIHMLKDLLRQGDFMAKIDLKDTYFAVPIGEKDRKHLRFRWRNTTFQFNCLHFGLSCAPWVFTKAVVAILREMGIRLIIYRRHPGHGRVGDSIEGPHSGDHPPPGELAIRYNINLPKSLLEPTKTIDFLGFFFGFHHHGTETSRRQDKEPPGKGKKDSDSRPHNSPGIIQPAGQNECYYKGSSDGSPLLSIATSGVSINTEQILSEKLWSSSVPLGASKGGASVVDTVGWVLIASIY